MVLSEKYDRIVSDVIRRYINENIETEGNMMLDDADSDRIRDIIEELYGIYQRYGESQGHNNPWAVHMYRIIEELIKVTDMADQKYTPLKGLSYLPQRGIENRSRNPIDINNAIRQQKEAEMNATNRRRRY